MGMMQSLRLLGTKPVNPLEEALMRFLKGQSGIDGFIELLLQSKVFVLLKGDPREVVDGTIIPLVLESLGRPAVCVFTSPQRANALRKQHPDFATGLEIEFPSFVRSIPAAFGMLINPGTFFSTEADSVAVDELRGAGDVSS